MEKLEYVKGISENLVPATLPNDRHMVGKQRKQQKMAGKVS